MRQFRLQELSGDFRVREEILTSLCQDDVVEISIAYDSDFRSAKTLREFVDSLCKMYGVSPKWRTRLVLIIDELNNNAIEYGSQKGDTNYLYIKLQKQDLNTLSISADVTDTWRWNSAKTAKDMRDLQKQHENKNFSSHKSIRGRWLFLIISHLVDTLYFKDHIGWWLTVGIKKVLSQDL